MKSAVVSTMILVLVAGVQIERSDGSPDAYVTAIALGLAAALFTMAVLSAIEDVVRELKLLNSKTNSTNSKLDVVNRRIGDR